MFDFTVLSIIVVLLSFGMTGKVWRKSPPATTTFPPKDSSLFEILKDVGLNTEDYDSAA
jgi:hypothetical protein